MSLPSDTNALLKIIEKLSKCKYLEIQVTKVWDIETTALFVIIRALDMVA